MISRGQLGLTALAAAAALAPVSPGLVEPGLGRRVPPNPGRADGRLEPGAVCPPGRGAHRCSRLAGLADRRRPSRWHRGLSSARRARRGPGRHHGRHRLPAVSVRMGPELPAAAARRPDSLRFRRGVSGRGSRPGAPGGSEVNALYTSAHAKGWGGPHDIDRSLERGFHRQPVRSGRTPCRAPRARSPLHSICTSGARASRA